MRFDAGRDVVVVPDARSHELVRYTRDGIRAKFGIDATRPFAEKDRYTRLTFEDTDKTLAQFGDLPPELAARLAL
jgi:2,5-furandicarboxylate decarboxylase 1